MNFPVAFSPVRCVLIVEGESAIALTKANIKNQINNFSGYQWLLRTVPIDKKDMNRLSNSSALTIKLVYRNGKSYRWQGVWTKIEPLSGHVLTAHEITITDPMALWAKDDMPKVAYDCDFYELLKGLARTMPSPCKVVSAADYLMAKRFVRQGGWLLKDQSIGAWLRRHAVLHQCWFWRCDDDLGQWVFNADIEGYTKLDLRLDLTGHKMGGYTGRLILPQCMYCPDRYRQWYIHQANEDSPMANWQSVSGVINPEGCDSHAAWPYAQATKRQLSHWVSQFGQSRISRQWRLCFWMPEPVLSIGQRIRLSAATRDLLRSVWPPDTGDVLWLVESVNGEISMQAGTGLGRAMWQYHATPIIEALVPDLQPEMIKPIIHSGGELDAYLHRQEDMNAPVKTNAQGFVPVSWPYQRIIIDQQRKAFRWTPRLTTHLAKGEGELAALYAKAPIALVYQEGMLERPLVIGALADQASGHLHTNALGQSSLMAVSEGGYWLQSHSSGDHALMRIGCDYGSTGQQSYWSFNDRPYDNEPDLVQYNDGDSSIYCANQYQIQVLDCYQLDIRTNRMSKPLKKP